MSDERVEDEEVSEQAPAVELPDVSVPLESTNLSLQLVHVLLELVDERIDVIEAEKLQKLE